jgi:hypothetical protein
MTTDYDMARMCADQEKVIETLHGIGERALASRP